MNSSVHEQVHHLQNTKFLAHDFFPHILQSIQTTVQSGLNTSESVILTNSNNDTDLVRTICFSFSLICYNRKFVFQLRHNTTGNQTCYFLYIQYPLHWHMVSQASDCSIILHFRTWPLSVIVYCLLWKSATNSIYWYTFF